MTGILQFKSNVLDNDSSQNLELAYNYFTTTGFGLVYTKHVRKNYRGLFFQSKWRTILYILNRLLAFTYFAYLVLLYLGFYENYFGKLDIFEKIEVFYWIVCYCVYLCTDPLFLDEDFTKAIILFFELSNQIWKNSTIIADEKIKNKLIHQRNWKQLKLIIHTFLFDWLEPIDYAYVTWGASEYQTNLYAISPWKNPIIEFIAWLLQILAWWAFCTCWSFLTTLPGLYAFHFEAIIKGLGESMDSGNVADLENKILMCRDLQFSLRLITQKMRYPLLFAHLTAEVPMIMEVFCGFQLIKAGAPVHEYIYYFVDGMTYATRLAHSFYALSTVNAAWKHFLDKECLWRYLLRNKQEDKACTDRRIGKLYRYYQSIHPMAMEMGPIVCKENLFLSGTSTLINYYITAAMWP